MRVLRATSRLLCSDRHVLLREKQKYIWYGMFLIDEHRRETCFSKNGLVTTIAWGLDGKVNYALEGSILWQVRLYNGFVMRCESSILHRTLNIWRKSKRHKWMLRSTGIYWFGSSALGSICKRNYCRNYTWC